MSEGPRLPASNVLSSLMNRARGAQGPYLPPAERAPKQLLTITGAPALEPEDAAALRHMLSLPPSAYEFGQLSGGFGQAPVFKSSRKPMTVRFAKHVCKRSCDVCKQGRGVCSRPGQPGHLSDERSLPNHSVKQRAASPPSEPPPGRRRRLSDAQFAALAVHSQEPKAQPKKKKAKVKPLVLTNDAKLTDEDGQELFEISHIVAERTRGKMGQREYLVRWKGYAASENTWEPASSISQLEWVMEAWRERKQKKKAKRKRAQPSSSGELSTEEEDAPGSASKASARRRSKGPPRKLDTKGYTEII